MKVNHITFSEILEVWATELWPGRSSPIEPHSAISFGHFPFEYNMKFMQEPPTFFGVFEATNLVGVNSGHGTIDGYRSRGLYVHPLYRGLGIGKKLLLATIDQAREEGKSYVWSMPRRSSIDVYESVGFVKVSDWFGTETAEANCFALRDL